MGRVEQKIAKRGDEGREVTKRGNLGGACKNGTYKNIFERDEQKYLLTAAQRAALLDLIGAEIEPDEYFEGTNCNLYFDTPRDDLIIKALEKPVFKQKVRLRSYGVPDKNSPVYLEAKVKYRGTVYKRRVQMRLADFWRFYRGVEREDKVVRKDEVAGCHDLAVRRQSSRANTQMVRELEYLFRYYDLRPAWVICYDRRSYRGRADATLRITFDHDLRSRTENLRLEAGDYGKLYFAEEMYVMEIKALQALPLWLVRALSRLEIYPTSFTKYGKIYEQARKIRKEIYAE